MLIGDHVDGEAAFVRGGGGDRADARDEGWNRVAAGAGDEVGDGR